MFLSIEPHDTTVKAEDSKENLLPEITNSTIQKSVSYAADSNPFHLMNVYLPVGEGPFPALIYIHAGGWAKGSRINYNTTASFYARRGIAGFSIDYTLTQNKTAWPQNIQDVIRAIRFIRQNAHLYNIDPTKIGVMGSSAGGHLASLAGVLSGNEPFLAGASGNPQVSSRVSLVVDNCGPTDLQFIGATGPTMRMFTIYNITRNLFDNVTYDQNPNLWTQASPATYVSSSDPIFYIAHGTNDTVVPIEISESFNSKLQAAGVETHFLSIQDGNHNMLITDQQNLVLRNSLEPLLKKVFNIDQQGHPEFPTPIFFTLALMLTLIAAVIIFSVKYTKKNRASLTTSPK
jgi:acetyl esterase/lipase